MPIPARADRRLSIPAGIAAALSLFLLSNQAAALEAAPQGVQLTKQMPSSLGVVPSSVAVPQERAPLDLQWKSPAAPGLWARVESPGGEADDLALRGVATLGQHLPLLNCQATDLWCDGLRLSVTPTLRGIPDAPTPKGNAPALGFGLVSDLALGLAPGLEIRASGALGDRLGIGAPLAVGTGTAAKLVTSLGADLSRLGGPALRVDASVAMVRDIDKSATASLAGDCEGALEFAAGHARVRFTLPCDESYGRTIGFELRKEF